MSDPVPALAERAAACADRLCTADEVLLASHIDADGLTSAAVASTALERAGIPHEVHFFDQLGADAIARVAGTAFDTVLFTDFGSGQLAEIAPHEAAGEFTPVVVDHHQPADVDAAFHLNPLLEGLDGAAELSGAGAAYVLARALEDAAGERGQPDVDNRDLAALAVVGAVGDMQASDGKLVGANREIVAEGVEAGALVEGTDLAIYGTQTRPLPKLLEFAGDVPIPGVTGDRDGALRFLDGLDVPLKVESGVPASEASGVPGNEASRGSPERRSAGGSSRAQRREGDWRRWVDLTDDEKQTVASALVQRAVTRGVPAEKVDRLVGTSYRLAAEDPGTELRDASEFSTLLNATARYDRADVGLAVCLGDRGPALERARRLLAEHRRNLSQGVDLVEQEGVECGEHLQWFHAGDRIRETIVGIVAGMAIGADGVSRQRPILAFAEKTDEESEVKVSARAPSGLVGNGLDLSAVMTEAAAAVGGEGGGHDVAAGATIPAGAEEAFLARADEVVGAQLGGREEA
jgi:RecJ-like exonuclease